MQIQWHKVWKIAMNLYPDTHPTKLTQEQKEKCINIYYDWY
jgi:uncharacterized protein YeaC (DUF1315 family)